MPPHELFAAYGRIKLKKQKIISYFPDFSDCFQIRLLYLQKTKGEYMPRGDVADGQTRLL